MTVQTNYIRVSEGEPGAEKINVKSGGCDKVQVPYRADSGKCQ